MQKSKLEHYRRVLLARRMDLQADMQKKLNAQKDNDRTNTMDTVDQADSSYTADYNIAVGEKINRQLREVDEALARIRDGVYGVCDSCGEEIPEERLKIRPNARYCAKCKEEMEKRGRIK